MTPQAVIFDIGRVLIEWHPEGFYDGVIGPARRKALFAATGLLAMNDRIDLGADFRATVHATAAAHPDWHDEILLWHDCWIDMASPAIDRSVRLLRALRGKGVTVLALSNFGVGTFDLARAHYPFLDEFDRRYVSGHLGCMKPDAAIYQILEDDIGLPPEALLFTDDRPENIETARNRGWQAHLFDGPEGWARALVRADLLTESEAA